MYQGMLCHHNGISIFNICEIKQTDTFSKLPEATRRVCGTEPCAGTEETHSRFPAGSQPAEPSGPFGPATSFWQQNRASGRLKASEVAIIFYCNGRASFFNLELKSAGPG